MIEDAIVVGLVRRRRNLSSLLCFIDVEVTESKARVQLVMDGWELPREISSGLTIEAKGKWETRGDSAKRLAVEAGGIRVLATRGREFSNPWAVASMHAQWRKDSGAQCECLDPLCGRIHVERSARWEERRELLHLSNQSAKASSSSSCSVSEADAATGDEDGHPSDLASKAKHNQIFGEFLLETYGEEWLRENGGVCEIAGGRGMLGEQLMIDYNIPTTLIEPKPVKLNRTSRKRWRKWLRKHNLPVPDDVAVLSPVKQYTEEFYGLTQASSEAQEALRKAAVIVGMHPDQATGAIVEAANELDKPFAVVPCCVFSRMFPDRLTPEGRPVALYEELLSFLSVSPNGSVQRATLPFEGRKVVLFRK